MHILHVITSINLGGAENHLYDLVSQQKRRGLQISVAYLKGDHYWAEKYKSLGVRVYYLNIRNFELFFLFYRLIVLIDKISPTLIHAHMPPAEIIARLALFKNNIPLIISKHNDEPFAPLIKNLFLGSWIAKKAKFIICISRAVQTYVVNNLNLDPNKTSVIYYGIDVSRFSNAIPLFDIKNKNTYIIGTIARLTPQKNLHTLLKAFCEMLKTIPDSTLVIVGVGELEKELKKLALNLNIQDKIIWMGKRSDIPNILKSFDVFTLTSIYEGFGLVLLEAMSAGVPIIASRVSAIPEVLNHGEAGLLFDPYNSTELTNGLIKLFDQDLRKKIKSAAFNRAEKDFSLIRMEDETYKAYQFCLAD